MARTRHQAHPASSVPLRALPAAALRAVLREGYGAGSLKADILAGLVVGIVALPLAMALSIAVGMPPQQGLYTAIVAGFLVALLGGSRTQVTGPTAHARQQVAASSGIFLDEDKMKGSPQKEVLRRSSKAHQTTLKETGHCAKRENCGKR